MIQVVETELFRVVRDELGVNLKSFISEKIVAVAGDVSDTNLGVKDSKLMEEMWTEIDLVLNFAAITNFDERYKIEKKELLVRSSLSLTEKTQNDYCYKP